MRLENISITNCAGFGSREFALPAVALVQGKNRAGKSALAACLKYPFEGGHDEAMLTVGEDKGEIVIKLDDGGCVRAVLDRAACSTDRYTRKAGEKRWIRNRSFIDEVTNSLSYDPLRFLRMNEKEQVLELLKVLGPHLTVSEKEFMDALGDSGSSFAAFPPLAQMSGLERVDTLLDERSGCGSLYDQRRDLNVSADTLKKHADVVQQALPPAAEDAHWGKVAAQKTADLAALDRVQRETKESIGKRLEQTREKAAEALVSAVETIDGDIGARIRTLEEEREQRKAAARKDRDAFVDAERAKANAEMAAWMAENTPRRDVLTAEHATAVERHQEWLRTEGSRKEIESSRAEAARKEADSARLTAALERLRGLRVKIAERIPIKGVRIAGGRIIDEEGVPLRKWNTEAQYGFCLRLAVLLHKELGFVVLDGAEAFDKLHRASLLKACEKYAKAEGMQFVLLSVGDSELTVESGEIGET